MGISDNIYRTMPPDTTNPVEVHIPPDHPSGTYWYHPHKHGAVTFQLISGMAGFLIIKGGPGTLDALPEVAAARDVVMGFQVIRTDLNGNVPFVNQKQLSLAPFPSLIRIRPSKDPGPHLGWMARRAKLLLLHHQWCHQSHPPDAPRGGSEMAAVNAWTQTTS